MQNNLPPRNRVASALSPGFRDSKTDAVTPGGVGGGHLGRVDGERVPEVRVDGHVVALSSKWKVSIDSGSGRR